MSNEQLQKIIRDHDLEWHTEHGWQLRQVLETQEVVLVSKLGQVHEDSLPYPPYSNDPKPEHLLEQSHLVTTFRFLMEKSADSELAELQLQLFERGMELDNARSGAKQLTKDVNDLKAQHEKLQTTFQDVQARKGEIEQKYRERCEELNAYVKVVAKFRLAVGTVKFKELVEQELTEEQEEALEAFGALGGGEV